MTKVETAADSAANALNIDSGEELVRYMARFLGSLVMNHEQEPVEGPLLKAYYELKRAAEEAGLWSAPTNGGW